MDILLACLDIDFGKKDEEQVVIENVLAKLPKEYTLIIETIERDLNQGKTVTLEDIKEEVRKKHKKVCKEKNVDPEADGTGEETALAFKQKFKGQCRTCGAHATRQKTAGKEKPIKISAQHGIKRRIPEMIIITGMPQMKVESKQKTGDACIAI